MSDYCLPGKKSPINANRTAVYDEWIEQQRTAISAIETCRQLKKSLFGKENATNDELVRMVLQLKSGKWMQETGGRTMKATPDELRRYAEICVKGKCSEQCPYYERENCVETMMADALAYIERIENRVKTDKE